MTTDYERAIDTLWKDVKELKCDLKMVVEALRDTAQEKVHERVEDARERADDMAARGADRLRDAASSAAEAGQQAVERAKSYIEERPLASLLVAIGIGAIVGGILHRRMAR